MDCFIVGSLHRGRRLDLKSLVLLGGGMTLDGLRAYKEGLEDKKVVKLRAEHQEGQSWAEQRMAKAIFNLRNRVGNRNASNETEDELVDLPRVSLF